MATTFHLFPYLPWELRAQIWELTIVPRTVEIQILDNEPELIPDLPIPSPFSSSNSAPRRRPPRIFSPTPVPAALHACHEARKHLTERSSAHQFYERAFADLPLRGTESRSEYSINNNNANASSSVSSTTTSNSHTNSTFHTNTNNFRAAYVEDGDESDNEPPPQLPPRPGQPPRLPPRPNQLPQLPPRPRQQQEQQPPQLPPRPNRVKQPRRYVYINFSLDTLLLRDGASLNLFVPPSPPSPSPSLSSHPKSSYNTRIKRLVIERGADMAQWYFQSSEPALLKSSFCPYLEELVIISEDARGWWFEEAENDGVFGPFFPSSDSGTETTTSPSLHDGAAPAPVNETEGPVNPKLQIQRYETLQSYYLSQTYQPLKSQLQRDLDAQRLASQQEAERIIAMQEEERRQGEEFITNFENESIRGIDETRRQLEESMRSDLAEMQTHFNSGSASGFGEMMGFPGFETRAQQTMQAMQGQITALRMTAGNGPEDIRSRIRADIEARRGQQSDAGDEWLRGMGVDVEAQIRMMEENQERLMRQAETHMAGMQRETEGARRGRIEGMVELLRDEAQRRREAKARMEEEAARFGEAQARMAAMESMMGPMRMRSEPAMGADSFDMSAMMREMGASTSQGGPRMGGVGGMGGSASWGMQNEPTMGTNGFDMNAMMREMREMGMNPPMAAMGSQSGPSMGGTPFDIEAMVRQAGATSGPTFGMSAPSALSMMQEEASRRRAEMEAAMRAMSSMQNSNPWGQQQWRS